MAMRVQFQWLFHLPSALRCRMILPLQRNTHDLRILQRQFSTTRCAYARHPPSPTRRTPAASPANKIAARMPPSRPSFAHPDIANLLSTSERVLLYKAPSHTSFFFSSYLFGSIIIGSSVVHISFTADDKELPWFSRLLTSGLALFLAVLGTTFILAPSKMIRSVSLARNQVTSAIFLQVRTKPALPFMSGDTINAPLNQVYIDKAINGDALPPYINIPLQDAERFTQFNSENADAPNLGILARLRELNRGFLNILPNLWWDTRRMFLRDGMVYVEILGQGHWKLDLRNAELLDNGKPLTASMVPASLDRSLLGRLRTLATG